ncbi:GH32 C-terminal domain-containing protein [Microbacterium sp. W4I20]|uniref:glycoside hydrolase family 32 protein n=1 Tax=Microbacterium sp. W4I20 TaxID=3042262 RepID=UPI00358F4CEA
MIGGALSVLLALGCVIPAAAADTNPGDPNPAEQQYRPLIHFTPEKNWMNDPNGMVYVDGTYHLFFQHNPAGTGWGNMSWGHATSTDLLHWEEQPLAIPQTFNDAGESIEDIFSGSIVVDENNSAGFGPAGSQPLVAIYTSAYTPQHPEHPGIQAQSLAYSLDDGQTWTKYDGNPVLDRKSANFRDPKVFWYDGPAGAYWVMTTVEATDHQVVLYKSTDLKSWEHLSDFGPANSVGGIWECPDLFELPVDGDPDNTKWVMVVNLNPGSVNGGSGGQYFVGDFDGVSFTSETTDAPGQVPSGTTFAGFDEGDYDGWTVSNEPGNRFDGPWGTAPATGPLDGQSPVTGFVGEGFANSFLDHDWAIGTLESPEFTIDDDYINLLVGGGKHPHVEGSQLGNTPPAGRTVFDFELAEGQTLQSTGWELTGDFAIDAARNPSTQGGEFFLGEKRVNTFEGGPNQDDNVGTMTSPAFTIDGNHVSFLLGGGRRDDGTLQAELLVDGEVVRSQTGRNAGDLTWTSWDVSEFESAEAQLRIRDDAKGGWAHLTFDHLVIGDEKSTPRSDETAVNLIVDGAVVRSATGSNSENLDWASWDVEDLRGKTATIQAVDNNRQGWGHLLFDQVTFSDAPAQTALEGYDWLDWGRDYYASVSYYGTPSGSRIMQGWMNNWDYAGDIPTPTWRGSMALPREVALTDTSEGPRLSQRVVEQIDGQLDTKAAETLDDVRIDGDTALGLDAEVAKLDVVLRPGDADSAGITVFSDGETGTRIGYDTRSGRVFIDRTKSGVVGFNPSFASVSDAPLALEENGTVTLELYLDRASVELFTDDGMLTITDQVFPEAGATAVSGWSRGGAATIESITVTPLTPTMWQVPEPGGDASIALSTKTVRAGDSITVSGSAFEPESTLALELRSDPVALGKAVVDGGGAFRQSVTIPATTPAGPHTLAVIRADGSEVTLPLTVTARSGTGGGSGGSGSGGSGGASGPGQGDGALPGGLANTGAEPWPLLAVGILSVLAGGAALVMRRIRRHLG